MGSPWQHRRRVRRRWAAALFGILMTLPLVANGKCARDPIRTYPRNGSQQVPIDTVLFLEFPTDHRLHKQFLSGDLPSLVAKDGSRIRLVLIRKMVSSPRSRPSSVTMRLRPDPNLKPGTSYQLDWRSPDGVPEELRRYGFVTGAGSATRLGELPKLLDPVLSLGKRGCGEHAAFSMRVLGADPTGVHEIQIARRSESFLAHDPAEQHLVAEFLQVQGTGNVLVGGGACTTNYRFLPGWRAWVRVRILAQDGTPGPWSVPQFLEADPKNPQTQWTCPPQS